MKYRYLVIGPGHNGGDDVFFVKDWPAINDIFAGNKECDPWWDGKQKFLTEKDIEVGDHSTTYRAPFSWSDSGAAQVMVLEIREIITPKAVQIATKYEK
jgi:hypothetical protein